VQSSIKQALQALEGSRGIKQSRTTSDKNFLEIIQSSLKVPKDSREEKTAMSLRDSLEDDIAAKKRELSELNRKEEGNFKAAVAGKKSKLVEFTDAERDTASYLKRTIAAYEGVLKQMNSFVAPFELKSAEILAIRIEKNLTNLVDQAKQGGSSKDEKNAINQQKSILQSVRDLQKKPQDQSARGILIAAVSGLGAEEARAVSFPEAKKKLLAELKGFLEVSKPQASPQVSKVADTIQTSVDQVKAGPGDEIKQASSPKGVQNSIEQAQQVLKKSRGVDQNVNQGRIESDQAWLETIQSRFLKVPKDSLEETIVMSLRDSFEKDLADKKGKLSELNRKEEGNFKAAVAGKKSKLGEFTDAEWDTASYLKRIIPAHENVLRQMNSFLASFDAKSTERLAARIEKNLANLVDEARSPADRKEALKQQSSILKAVSTLKENPQNSEAKGMLGVAISGLEHAAFSDTKSELLGQLKGFLKLSTAAPQASKVADAMPTKAKQDMGGTLSEAPKVASSRPLAWAAECRPKAPKAASSQAETPRAPILPG